MFKRHLLARLLAASVLMGTGASVFAAGSSSGAIPVSITVAAQCVINAVGPIAFGNVSLLATTNATASGGMNLSCTNGSPYTVGLDGGTTPGGTPSARLMTNGTSTLSYGLYQNAAMTQVWDNSSNMYGNNGGGGATGLSVYAQIPKGQPVTPGSYSDTVTIIVSY